MVAVSSRILSLNLRHGGGSRANLLIDWIASKAPFVAVLTEWRENASGRLIKDIHTDQLARGRPSPDDN